MASPKAKPKTKPRAKSKAKPRAEPSFSRTCSLCGTVEKCAEGGIPPGWSFSVEGKRNLYICSACARVNIRAIEGKLPEEYWE